jgi:hypothetical protein
MLVALPPVDPSTCSAQRCKVSAFSALVPLINADDAAERGQTGG